MVHLSELADLSLRLLWSKTNCFYPYADVRFQTNISTDEQITLSARFSLSLIHIFLAEVKYLKEKAPEIDLVLFPVDRRMGKDYMKGAKQFIEQIKTTIFVPMHFSEDYEGGNALRDFAENAGCRFVSITHRGESFEITK